MPGDLNDQFGTPLPPIPEGGLDFDEILKGIKKFDREKELLREEEALEEFQRIQKEREDNVFYEDSPTQQEYLKAIGKDEESDYRKEELTAQEKILGEFIKATYKETKVPESISAVLVRPRDQLWEDLEKHQEPHHFGEATFNPEAGLIDFESREAHIISLSDMIGKKISEVAEHVVRTYGQDYYIPGLEYLAWLRNNHKWFQDLTHYYFFGSVVCDASGNWGVPFGTYDSDAGSWQNISKLNIAWRENFRIVLIKK